LFNFWTMQYRSICSLFTKSVVGKSKKDKSQLNKQKKKYRRMVLEYTLRIQKLDIYFELLDIKVSLLSYNVYRQARAGPI